MGVHTEIRDRGSDKAGELDQGFREAANDVARWIQDLAPLRQSSSENRGPAGRPVQARTPRAVPRLTVLHRFYLCRYQLNALKTTYHSPAIPVNKMLSLVTYI